MSVPFVMRWLKIFRPNNLIHETLGLPLTIIGTKTGSHLAKDIQNSLHLDPFSWNLFAYNWIANTETASWILLVWFLGTS